MLGDLSFFLRNESRVQLVRYKARLKPKAKIGNMMTERQFLRIFIFFCTRFRACSINKIQRAYKEQSKIRKSDAEALASRKIYLFYTALSPCSINKIQSPYKA